MEKTKQSQRQIGIRLTLLGPAMFVVGAVGLLTFGRQAEGILLGALNGFFIWGPVCFVVGLFVLLRSWVRGEGAAEGRREP